MLKIKMHVAMVYLFLESGPIHVPNVSPTPARPPKVSLSAPNNSPTLA